MTFNEIEDIFYENQLLDKYNIEKIGIFGSLARGENGNDVDIFIELDHCRECFSDSNCPALFFRDVFAQQKPGESRQA